MKKFDSDEIKLLMTKLLVTYEDIMVAIKE